MTCSPPVQPPVVTEDDVIVAEGLATLVSVDRKEGIVVLSKIAAIVREWAKAQREAQR